MILWLPAMIYSQSIVTTKHNLSVQGPGDLKSSSETEICLFCHTPHSSRPLTPLWNRNDQGVIYTLYSSSTLQALPGQPDGTSILCLSCHDGTIALGSVISRSSVRAFQEGVTTMPAGLSNLNTNLKNDHPISFLYTSSLALADGQLRPPSAIIPPVSLEKGKVQCTSCHNPHKNMISLFWSQPLKIPICVIAVINGNIGRQAVTVLRQKPGMTRLLIHGPTPRHLTPR
jgi:hypothetical protein